MKKSITILAITALLILSISSCRGSRYGCPGQGSGFGWVGYK